MAANRTETRLDNEHSFTVEWCIDSPEWAWTLLCYGQDERDGYAATEREAKAAAREAYRERMEWLKED